jgi:hypothetical protein
VPPIQSDGGLSHPDPRAATNSGSQSSFAPLAGQPTYSEIYGSFDDPALSGTEAMDIDTTE